MPENSLIRLLPENVRNRIAAGEVVERPANAVKELVENAFDAEASNVFVEVADGGKRLIRVSDDGEGMTREDLILAVRRFATSKIRDENDIFRVSTLGFRGEALPSIAAVSETTVTTRRADSDTAWRLSMIGGKPEGEPEPVSAAPGTSVEVRELFRYVPARLKFLSTSAAENRRIIEWLIRLALSRPDVGITLKADGTRRLQTSPEQSLHARATAIYGKQFSEELLAVDYINPETVGAEYQSEHLAGLVGPPSLNYHNSSRMMVFVNGRAVFDKLLLAAVRNVFSNRIPPRRFPVCFLHFSLDPREVDVNVHPTKIEVRFLRQRFMFGFIRRALQNALDPAPVKRSLSSAGMDKNAADGFLRQSPELGSERRESNSMRENTNRVLRKESPPRFNAFSVGTTPGGSPETGTGVIENHQGETGLANRVAEPTAMGTASKAVSADNQDGRDTSRTQRFHASEESGMSDAGHPLFARVVGQLHEKYIIVESPEGMEIIDQHALHERIIYERLTASTRTGRREVQPLLIPEMVELSPDQAAALDEVIGACGEFGLEVENLDGTAVIRALPVGIPVRDARDALLAFIDDYADTGTGRADPARLRQRAIYWTSCKSAIKAGRRLDISEIEQLLADYRALCGLSSYTCPHGRPISWKIDLAEIDRRVGR